jgi:lysophospholipase L1-like esterase
MKALILILTGITSLLSCSKTVTPLPDFVPVVTNTASTMPVSTTPLTYLALGDSYTIGESVEQKDNYPYQLAVKLSNYKVQPPTIIATTGWTADNLIEGIAKANITGNTYDIVTLLIGVNDQYQGLSQANYRTKFVQLLNSAIKFAKGNKKRVFVVSIPDWGVTPYANGNDAKIAPEIDQFNAINKEESDKAGVNYINITPISKEAATNPLLTASDGLHPSAVMYAKWVEAIAPVVVRQLK